MRENVALHFRAAESAAAHFEGIFVSFAPHDGGINGGERRAHGIILGHEEKVDRAIGAGGVAVEADAEAEDDLAHGRPSKRGIVNCSTASTRKSAALKLTAHDLPPMVALLGRDIHELNTHPPLPQWRTMARICSFR